MALRKNICIILSTLIFSTILCSCNTNDISETVTAGTTVSESQIKFRTEAEETQATTTAEKKKTETEKTTTEKEKFEKHCDNVFYKALDNAGAGIWVSQADSLSYKFFYPLKDQPVLYMEYLVVYDDVKCHCIDALDNNKYFYSVSSYDYNVKYYYENGICENYDAQYKVKSSYEYSDDEFDDMKEYFFFNYDLTDYSKILSYDIELGGKNYTVEQNNGLYYVFNSDGNLVSFIFEGITEFESYENIEIKTTVPADTWIRPEGYTNLDDYIDSIGANV